MGFTAIKTKSCSRHANTGYGPKFSVIDIGLPDKAAVIEPDTAFWAVVEKDSIENALSGSLVVDFKEHADGFKEEMDSFRFKLKPSAVYFNPTELCNLNCTYCYLPEDMRRSGVSMSKEALFDNLEILSRYFSKTMDESSKPQVIFHGSEPMVAKEAVFAGIEKYGDRFHFGIQTNATFLDDEAISFLKTKGVGIGVSLDSPDPSISDSLRKGWDGSGSFKKVLNVIRKLSDYPAFNVISTVTSLNVHTLPQMVEFLHDNGVSIAMLNPVRCTQKGGAGLKPENDVLSQYLLKALDRAFELYTKTGRKILVTNFANVLMGIMGPTGRRLMCDISPCGGGRCFFALSAKGGIFPCSEFIGMPQYEGGNIAEDDIDNILKSKPFEEIKARKVENFKPCDSCSIRHFCGAPCPAEVRMLSGTVNAPSPYCEFYEEMVRYAFRVIAGGRENAFLWDGWKEETDETFSPRGSGL